MHTDAALETSSIASVLSKPAKPVSAAAGHSAFIVSPGYDTVFFIFSPLLALVLGAVLSWTPLAAERFVLYGKKESWISLFSGAFTMAHLFIVFFRSHADRSIFKLYPYRFTVVPLFLFLTMMVSSWVLVFVFVLAVWWDVYHSSLQTFGLGRIYDARLGNSPAFGRNLDRGLNLLLYAGPVLGGAILLDHVEHFHKFQSVGSAFFEVVPAYASTHHRYLTWGVLALGVPYLFYYLYAYRRAAQNGYRASHQKALLLGSTALCSIYTWGFNSFGQAFFIMNFFHAWQYFAIVWWAERKNIAAFFRLENFSWGNRAALGLFLLAGFGYGLWAKLLGESSHFSFSLLLTVSIMHFWYDGFVWSVRKGQV